MRIPVRPGPDCHTSKPNNFFQNYFYLFSSSSQAKTVSSHWTSVDDAKGEPGREGGSNALNECGDRSGGKICRGENLSRCSRSGDRL